MKLIISTVRLAALLITAAVCIPAFAADDIPDSLPDHIVGDIAAYKRQEH